MSRSSLAKVATLAGVLLLLAAAVLFANGHFCIFNKASCGMVEPLLALPVLLLGFCLTVVGALTLRYYK